MLRHSASQIFGSKHPALTRASAYDDRTPPPAWMWGISSGNSRMVAHQQQQRQDLLSQAQTQPQPQPQYTEAAAYEEGLQPCADPSLFAPAPAMPAAPLGVSSAHHEGPQAGADLAVAAALAAEAHDRSASSLHPVFFTERLHRSASASAFALGAAAVTSPVAHGYAYHENPRRADGAIPAML